MTEKNIQIKNASGDILYPKTKASLVMAGDGTSNLGTVEAGAQVNKIEKITLNGREVAPASKAVALVTPEFTVAKASSATAGYAATYYLQKDGANIGDAINIPKDMVVQSGSVKTVDTADKPVAGFKVGDKYIDLVLANADNQHIYILVTDLVDIYTTMKGATSSAAGKGGLVPTPGAGTQGMFLRGDGTWQTPADTKYTGGTGITITGTTISVDQTKVAMKATTLSGYGITDALTFEEIS